MRPFLGSAFNRPGAVCDAPVGRQTASSPSSHRSRASGLELPFSCLAGDAKGTVPLPSACNTASIGSDRLLAKWEPISGVRSEVEGDGLRGCSVRRLVVAAGVIASATMAAGCAATGTPDAGSSSASSSQGATVASTSIAAAAVSSVSSATPSTLASSPSPTAGQSSAPLLPGPPVDPTRPQEHENSSSAASEQAAGSTVPPSAADGSQGWYDTWGWVSPQTAAAALAAGIAAGKDVRDELRCGTSCGESPTAAEIQTQFVLDHPDNPNGTVEAYEAAAAACPGYFISGNCYADAGAARDAGESE